MSSRIQRIDVPEDERRAIFAYLKRQDPGSKKCFDCSNKAPTWASIHFGIYVCIDCSGRHRAMGTHITFVQSTDIDQWTVENLRFMKYGGNNKAAEAMGSSDNGMRKYLDNGGSILPLPGNYKEKLKALVEKDRAMYPDRIYIEALQQNQASTSAAVEEEDELDWLDSQISGTSKPKAAPKPVAKPVANTSTSLPGIGGIGRTTSSASTASRTTTSSAILGSGASTPAASRTSSSSTLGAVKKSALGATKPASKLGAKKGLGATKAAGGVSAFEEAAKRAQEEEGKRLKEEEVRKAKEDEEKRIMEEEKKRADEARRAAGISTPPISSTPVSGSTSASKAKETNAGGGAEMERLGMGVRKMGFGSMGAGAAAGGSSAAKKKAQESDDVKAARERFGGQKAISSDMYFERNEYDPSTVTAAQTRLSDFKGATSISSNQYFGRPEPGEEDGGQGTSYGGGGGSYLNAESLSGLESSARDAIQRVMNTSEAQSVQDAIRTGALKLSDYLARYG